VDVLDGAAGVLAALDPEQRAVALAVRGPVCVLAGAGTGKWMLHLEWESQR
jgi:hypothetical protein